MLLKVLVALATQPQPPNLEREGKEGPATEAGGDLTLPAPVLAPLMKL